MSKSRFIAVNRLTLHCLDYGTEGNPPLVCIHGLTGNAHHFDSLAPHLNPAYHVLAPDVRGRGESQWGPADEYNGQSYVSDLVGMLDGLGLARVTLVGTSMGGMVAIMFAGGYPDRVERLVLNDIGPELHPAGLERICDGLMVVPTEFDDIEAVAAYYRATYPAARGVSEEQLAEWASWSVKREPKGKLVWKIDPEIRASIRGGAARTLDLWVPFARISAPVLVLRGAESDLLSARTVEQMKAVAPQLEAIEIPGVGHAPTLGERQALEAIRKFLRL